MEAARGGTLFLDEVGDIPLAMQVKLLRLIESGSYRPVGSITPKQADFRLICATHQKLEEMISEGTFRRDLYYRISPFPVYLPTLNERPEDIIPLATHLLEQLSRHRVLQLSDRACDWLISHKYRGNIRELRNLLERAVLLCDGNSVEPEHLEPFPASSAILSSESITLGSSEILPLANLESVYLERIARAYTGDNAALAKKLGVSERTLYRKLRQLRDQHQNDDI